MMNKHRTSAIVLTVLFLSSCPIMASGGGGGAAGDEEDSNIMVYVTIGLAVVIGGLLVLDVLADSDDEIVQPDLSVIEVVDTGVNWDEVFPSDPIPVTIGVSVFPGDSESSTSMEFIHILNEISDNSFTVYNDPLDLGDDTAMQRAAIAHEYFGVDLLIFQIDDNEFLQYGIASPDSILWTSTDESVNSILLIVEDLMQSGILQITSLEPQ